MVGVIGGEPLMHPEFKGLCEIMADAVPKRRNRGLWTGLPWQSTGYASLIKDTYGHVHKNLHNTECRHSPVLVAVRDAVPDERERQELIKQCWVQNRWCGTVTPKGLFFCEVAGAMDWVMQGPGGLPIEPGCWQRPLGDFQEQIDRWCPGCGLPLNLRGRLDYEEMDDISQSNLEALEDSPRIKAGRYVPYTSPLAACLTPWRYKK
jgi:hypothetical protein